MGKIKRGRASVFGTATRAPAQPPVNVPPGRATGAPQPRVALPCPKATGAPREGAQGWPFPLL